MTSYVWQSKSNYVPFAASSRPQCKTYVRVVRQDGSCEHHHDYTEAHGFSRRELALSCTQLGLSCMLPFGADASLLPSFGQQNPQFAAPIRFPRNKLDLRFAVLMMHSIYEAVDRLNIVPSSAFQSTFWKRRQKEYEPYLQQYSPIQIRQGDLTDPLYFDFISFAQVSTVGEDILKNASSNQQSVLLAEIQHKVGDLIFAGLRDGFREEVFNGPEELPAGSHISKLATGVQSILDIFVQKGFALKASIADISAECGEGSCDYHGANGSRGKFTIRVEGPADLWGMNTAGLRGNRMMPDFIGFAVDGFLRASQAGPSYKSSLASSAITQKWLLV